jgi:hypothetical protein
MVNASRTMSVIATDIVMTDGNFLFGCLRCMVYLVHGEQSTPLRRVWVSAPRVLRLVPANDRQQVVPLEELACRLVPTSGSTRFHHEVARSSRVIERAAPDFIMQEERSRRMRRRVRVRVLLVPEVADRVRPKKVTEQTKAARLGEAVDLRIVSVRVMKTTGRSHAADPRAC